MFIAEVARVLPVRAARIGRVARDLRRNRICDQGMLSVVGGGLNAPREGRARSGLAIRDDPDLLAQLSGSSAAAEGRVEVVEMA
ncbi:hypothetical protein ACLQ22_18215 [Micromonospora sp. DT178]|uniref:hypothetical protein n=1 Tax=Micromonospora sp. DT178 TaxID=3393436 RepID=UPI003CE70272